MKIKFLKFLFITMAVSIAGIHGASATDEERPQFVRVPTQFIAALGEPGSSSGTGAQDWGLWTVDPGPRGVWLTNYEQLKNSGGRAPANWQFDGEDWWLEEHGLIMEAPDFPIPAGRYIVTGDREVMTMLTVHEKDENGEQKWELANGASLYDVTHLPCRSARYTPLNGEGSCTPANAHRDEFPVTPGAVMPSVEGCHKQDYAVLFVIAVEVKS